MVAFAVVATTLVVANGSPASAHNQEIGVQGANKALTPKEARAWSKDLKDLAVATSGFCASKVINDQTPPGKRGRQLIERFSGTDNACTAARQLALTAVDLRRLADQKPLFGFSVKHVHRRRLPDTCRLRLAVSAGSYNKVRTINASGHHGIC
jgi:hypothetical protein